MWIAILHIPPSVERKLRDRRGITPDHLREGLVCRDDFEARSVLHEEHGWGFHVTMSVTGLVPLRVVLYPADGEEDAYVVATAFDPERSQS